MLQRATIYGDGCTGNDWAFGDDKNATGGVSK
jgi:hypothetical protein